MNIPGPRLVDLGDPCVFIILIKLIFWVIGRGPFVQPILTQRVWNSCPTSDYIRQVSSKSPLRSFSHLPFNASELCPVARLIDYLCIPAYWTL